MPREQAANTSGVYFDTARVIAATNRDLAGAVSRNEFRQDPALPVEGAYVENAATG